MGLANSIHMASPPSFLCAICLDDLTDASTLTCGHSFCIDHIRHWVTSRAADARPHNAPRAADAYEILRVAAMGQDARVAVALASRGGVAFAMARHGGDTGSATRGRRNR